MSGVWAALVNWNGMKYLGRCLDSVFAQCGGALEVVLVDNGSTDGSREWVRQHYPQVRLLENEANEGFAAGSNRAIAACGGSYILLLNTDVFLAADFVERALEGFARGAEVAAVTGRIFEEGTGRLISGGFYLRRTMRLVPSANVEVEEEVFGASGAVVLFRREALEALRVEGEYFDESYFMYGEDLDLAWRAQLWGWKILFQPGAFAHHVGSGSLGGCLRFVDMPVFFQRHALKNRYLNLVKNASPGLLCYLLPFLLPGEILAWLYLLLRLPGRMPALLGALADTVRLVPAAWRKRRYIQRRRRVGAMHLHRFFRGF